MVEPTRDFSSEPSRSSQRVYYAQTEGSIRYHLRRDCRGLKRVENGPVYYTTVEIVESNDGLELVEKGRNLCRICRPLTDQPVPELAPYER